MLGAIAHQPAGRGSFALAVDRRNCSVGPPAPQSVPVGTKESANTANQRASPTLDERCKGGLNFAFAADVEDFNLPPRAPKPQLVRLRQSVP